MSTATITRPVSAFGGAVYNHRDFWMSGYNAGGLDKATLTDADEIEFDNGKRVPAFARLTYGPQHPHGPFRPLSEQQTRFLAVNAARFLTDVRPDGTAVVVHPCGHYVPVVYHVQPDGAVERTN